MNSISSNVNSINTLTLINIRRYFSVSVLGFFYIFIIYIFPDLLNITPYYQNSMLNELYGLRFYCMFMPLITSIVLFSYLHRKNSVLYMHSMPFTRFQIMASNTIAGVVILNLPVMILGIFTVVKGDATLAVKMICYTFVSSFFVFALSNLAAVMAGTIVMHLIMACWFNIAAHSLSLIIIVYGSIFLHGFSIYYMQDTFSALSPITSQAAAISTEFMIYLLISLTFTAIAFFLYSRLKLERTGNSVTFRFMRIVMNLFICLYGTAIISIPFYSAVSSLFVLILSGLLGGILSATFGYMLTHRTTRLTIKSIIKIVATTLVVLAGMMAIFYFDITGYEKKIPDINSIESVEIPLVYSDDMADYYAYENVSEFYNIYKKRSFESRDIISNVLKMHENFINTNINGIYNFPINYNLKSGKTIKRVYAVENLNMQEFKYICESGEYKKVISMDNLKEMPQNISIYSIYNEEVGDISITASDSAKIAEWMELLNKDILNRSFDETDEVDVFAINLMFKNDSLTLYISKSDKYLYEKIKKYYK